MPADGTPGATDPNAEARAAEMGKVLEERYGKSADDKIAAKLSDLEAARAQRKEEGTPLTARDASPEAAGALRGPAVAIRLEQGQLAVLTVMSNMGLWGSTVPAIVEHLFKQALLDAMQQYNIVPKFARKTSTEG